jgi:hypothetical protein
MHRGELRQALRRDPDRAHTLPVCIAPALPLAMVRVPGLAILRMLRLASARIRNATVAP